MNRLHWSPPAGSVRPPGREPRRGWLLALIPAFSGGLFSFVPFLVGAMIHRSRRYALYAVLYTVPVLWLFVAIGTVEPESAWAGLAVFGLMLSWAGGTAHAAVVGDRLITAPRPARPTPAPPGPAPIPPQASVDPAVARALARRTRREEARRLLASDPSLARELGIGRPDLPRQYDDGGLIDVNHVPAEILVRELGFPPQAAAQVVLARETRGPFTELPELEVYANVPADVLARVADRLLFLPN
ncbi:helix-hairpin-helix domain-containing protein [Carbonactinospora thermoautotrophica]|uniref:helix-hairpin-helix domain-containing protein n=1 Tax=Carbonactinospora thermoautotrophica TaxID=1469144 RepID=UPI0011467A9B|nr:helix-hairpin-helix domain-containing protein [Carbonactinospora thermoautotrophica]